MGKAGYRAIAADIFRTADEIKAAVRSHPELTLIGDSLFNVAFRAPPDELDIFHVNDGLADLGWRMNGLQLPAGAALLRHPARTRSRVSPRRSRATWPRPVEYAKNPPSPMPRSGAMYGAGGASRPTATSIRDGIADRLDAIHEVGPPQ